jgi:hypothetical protein
VVLRSAVEGAIAINALAKDPGFVDQMVEAHLRSERAMARVQSDRFADLYSAEVIAIMKATIARADGYEASKGKELTDIKWEQVAEKHCPSLYQFFYRSLSSDGTHATIKSLDRFLVVDTHGKVTDFKAAPHTDGLVDTLADASFVFLSSADPYGEASGLSDTRASFNERVRELAALLPRALAWPPSR